MVKWSEPGGSSPCSHGAENPGQCPEDEGAPRYIVGEDPPRKKGTPDPEPVARYEPKDLLRPTNPKTPRIKKLWSRQPANPQDGENPQVSPGSQEGRLHGRVQKEARRKLNFNVHEEVFNFDRNKNFIFTENLAIIFTVKILLFA